MKIRTDFVTNSSSSSFTLIVNVGVDDGRVISTGEMVGNEMDNEAISVMGSPLYFAYAKNIDELITFIKESFFIGEDVEDYLYDGKKFYAEYPVDVEVKPLFDDETSFIKDVRKIKSISDIDYIEIIANTAFDEMIEKYRINMDDFSYVCEKEGELFESEGVDGKICFEDYYDENNKCACCKFCEEPVQRSNAYIGKWSFGVYCSKECYEKALKYNLKDITDLITYWKTDLGWEPKDGDEYEDVE